MSTKTGQGFAIWTESHCGYFARVSINHLCFVYTSHFIHSQVTGSSPDGNSPALSAMRDLWKVAGWTKNLEINVK